MRSKNAFKNIAISLLSQAVIIICGFIVPRLIIQTYGSATNGLINSITQFLAYITLLESGFGPVVKSILYKPIAEKNKKRIEIILKSAEKFFRKIALIFIGYIGILCLIYPTIVDNQFDTWYTISLLIIIAFSIFAEYFFGMTYSLYLQSMQKTYISTFIQIATTILSTCAVLLLINLGCSIQIVKLATAIILILKPIIQNYYVKKKYHININAAKGNYAIKQKWDGLAQHIASVVHGNTDIIVLSVFSTMKEVSVYSVYFLVIKGVKNLAQAFNNGIDASFGDMLAKKEHETIRKKIASYELFYHTIISIIFICTISLISPFVAVYTTGINDTDYIKPIFGAIITIAEFIWAIRLPYSTITLAAGHFKQTTKGAWVEASLNIVISVILVPYLGITGVAVGTAIAMLVRTIEFMIYSSRHIVKRSVVKPFSWLTLIIVESIIAFSIINALQLKYPTTYSEWAAQAIIVFIIATATVITINLLTHFKEARDLAETFRKIVTRRKG